LDAAQVRCAKLPHAARIDTVVETCLIEAFFGKKRDEGVAWAESRLLVRIELEPEVRRIGAAVSLREPRRADA